MRSDVVILDERLPEWIQRAQRATDWGVLIVIGCCLLLGWPFLVNEGLPSLTHAEHYLFRAADMVEALENGYLYPRWSPHAAYGYGAPIPNFAPPGAPYATALLHIFFTSDTVLAMRLFYVFSSAAAGAAVYALVLNRLEARTALLAALLYSFSPYVGLTAPHVTGDLADVMAAAALPTLLWALDHKLRYDRPLEGFFTGLAAGALLLIDPIIYAAGILLSGLLIGIHLMQSRPRKTALKATLSLGLGTLLAAFYWLPAIVENPLVTWLPTPVDSRIQPLTLEGLFVLPDQIDPAMLFPEAALTPGILLMILAIVPVFALVFTRRTDLLPYTAFTGMGVAILTFAIIYRPDAHSLLIPIALCLTLGAAGIPLLWNHWQQRYQKLYMVGILALTFIAAIPLWLGRTQTYPPIGTSPLEQYVYQENAYGIPGVIPGSSAPVTLNDLSPSSVLGTAYRTRNVIRFGTDTLVQSQASTLRDTGYEFIYQFQYRGPATITLMLAHYPGWHAELDGQPLELTRDPLTGLSQITLPAITTDTTTQTVRIALETTPLRTTAWAVSWGALLLLILILRRQISQQTTDLYIDHRLLNIRETRLILLVITLMMAAIVWFGFDLLPISLRQTPGFMLDNTLLLRNHTNGTLRAVATDIDATTYNPGNVINITLYWETLAPQNNNLSYAVSLELRDIERGRAWHTTPQQLIGQVPSSRWPSRRLVSDQHQIHIPINAPEGRYILAVEAVACRPDCLMPEPVTFFDQGGNSLGQVLTIPQVIVVEAR